MSRRSTRWQARGRSRSVSAVCYATIPFLTVDRYAARVLMIEDATEFARFYKILSAIDRDEVAAINAKLNKKS
jgi:hypothetical protein